MGLMIAALSKLSDLALAHRRWTYAIWLVLILMSCAGLIRLSFSYDYRSFFDAANPELASFDAIEKQFSPTDSVNFVLHTTQGDMFDAKAMEVLDWLTDRVLSIPYASRSQSPANYQFSYAQDDDLIVEPLFEPGRIDAFERAETRAMLRQRALGEKGLVGALLSPDFKTAQVIATIRLPMDEGNVLPVIKADVDTIKAELAKRAPNLRVATTGVVMLSQTFFEITLRDMVVLFPAITLAIALLLGWFFGSWRAAMLCLTIITLSICMAMGLAGWFGVQLTPATGPAPIIIMTIALVDSVHLLAGYFKARRTGLERNDAIRSALDHNVRAILLTSITTAIGFLALNFSDTPPFRELGNISAGGTLLALFLSVTLLPALLMAGKAGALVAATPTKVKSFSNLAATTKALRWPLLVLAAAALVFHGYASTKTNVEDNFVEWVNPGHEFRVDAEFIQDKLPSLFTQQYALETSSDAGITDPAYLKELEAFASYIESQPGVAHVASFDVIMRRLNKNLHDDDPAFDTLPSNAPEAAQYLLLYEMSLPFGEDLTTVMSIDRKATRISVTLNPQSSSDMQALRQKIFDWAEKNLTISDAKAGTGTNMIFAELTRSNTQSMLIGSIVAAVLIGLALMIALRSWSLGTMSLVPNVAPPIYAFGMWAVFVGSLGLYGAFVVSTSLGLIVDATVHMLEKYQKHNAIGTPDPVNAMLEDVGPAIVVSSAVLIAGFGILTFSNFAVISHLGELVVLTLGLAIVTDFLMVPAMLYVFKPGAKAASGASTSSV